MGGSAVGPMYQRIDCPESCGVPTACAYLASRAKIRTVTVFRTLFLRRTAIYIVGQNSDECLVACGHAPRPESLEPDALLDGDAPRPLGVEALPVLLGGHFSGRPSSQ